MTEICKVKNIFRPVCHEDEVPLNMNINEAGRYLNTTPRQLRDLVRANLVPHFRVGRLIRFNRKRLQKWVESQIEEPFN